MSGFNESVLQRGEMNYHLASSLFWINLGLGVVVTAGFAAAGPLLGQLLRTARLCLMNRFFPPFYRAGKSVGVEEPEVKEGETT